MSHGPHSDSTNAEPNLVPLLDLVLQLVMFFMMCANFAMREADESIKLPTSQQAKPVAETGPDVVHIGIDAEGAVRILGKPPMTTDKDNGQAVLAFLRAEVFEPARRRASAKGEGEVKTLVIIRADKNVAFDKVYRVMRLCQQSGLLHMQLRADQTGVRL